jgi:hypothetical protein
MKAKRFLESVTMLTPWEQAKAETDLKQAEAAMRDRAEQVQAAQRETERRGLAAKYGTDALTAPKTTQSVIPTAEESKAFTGFREGETAEEFEARTKEQLAERKRQADQTTKELQEAVAGFGDDITKKWREVKPE